MSFLIIYSDSYEFISERLGSNGEIVTNPEDMPWNISSNAFDIWPHIMSNSLGFIGVYWPQKYEIIFLIDNGYEETSALVYNDIRDKNWWKPQNLKRSPIRSNVFFNGLFHLNESIYAIGNFEVYKLYVNELGEMSLINTV